MRTPPSVIMFLYSASPLGAGLEALPCPTFRPRSPSSMVSLRSPSFMKCAPSLTAVSSNAYLREASTLVAPVTLR